MGVKRAVRADDERVLAMLAARVSLTSTAIGPMFGMTSTAVRVTTNRVVRDDLDHSGEDPAVVLAGYPFRDGRLA